MAAARTVAVPPWLEEEFPLRKWDSLRCCLLRVDPEQGAGLELEGGELGYHVDAVAATPGQDPTVCAGDIIVAIGGDRLLGLPEGQVSEVFGARFSDGAELLLVCADELREAVAKNDEDIPEEETVVPPEDNPNYELLRRQKSETEQEATVRIPVGRATVWSLPPDTASTLEQDLQFLGTKFGLTARAQQNREGSMESVVLVGLPSAIARARPEVVQILDFYRGGRWAASIAGQPSDAAGGQAAGVGEAAGGEQNRPATSPSAGELIPVSEIPEHVRDLRQFKYHDHTADIIVHSWGKTRAEAFAQVCVGMFEYMTELDAIDPCLSVEVVAHGHDLLDLLYHLLDEFLFVFGTTMHVSRRVEILEYDEEALYVRARGYGERMDLSKHSQGTEIKAITMHMMRILGPDSVQTENGTVPRAASGDPVDAEFPHEVYVLLDI